MIKKLIKWGLRRYNFYKLYQEYLNEIERTDWFNNVTSFTSNYYEGASVKNFQADRSKIVLHNNVVIRGHLKVLKYGGEITIKENSYIGNNSEIWSGCSVCIEENVLISDRVFITDTNSHEINKDERQQTYLKILKDGAPIERGNIEVAPVLIKRNSWISYGCVILKGVTIGEGAIIGAGSVVTKDIPNFSFAAGNPAVVIKYLNEKSFN